MSNLVSPKLSRFEFLLKEQLKKHLSVSKQNELKCLQRDDDEEEENNENVKTSLHRTSSDSSLNDWHSDSDSEQYKEGGSGMSSVSELGSEIGDLFDRYADFGDGENLPLRFTLSEEASQVSNNRRQTESLKGSVDGIILRPSPTIQPAIGTIRCNKCCKLLAVERGPAAPSCRRNNTMVRHHKSGCRTDVVARSPRSACLTDKCSKKISYREFRDPRSR